MAANVSGAGGVDEPFADFSRGEIAEVTQNAGNSRRKPASNFSIQDERQARSRVSGRGESRCGFVRKKFLCNRSHCGTRTTRSECRASRVTRQLSLRSGVWPMKRFIAGVCVLALLSGPISAQENSKGQTKAVDARERSEE